MTPCSDEHLGQMGASITQGLGDRNKHVPVTRHIDSWNHVGSSKRLQRYTVAFKDNHSCSTLYFFWNSGSSSTVKCCSSISTLTSIPSSTKSWDLPQGITKRNDSFYYFPFFHHPLQLCMEKATFCHDLSSNLREFPVSTVNKELNSYGCP